MRVNPTVGESPAARRVLASIAIALLSSACATYSDKTLAARQAADVGDYAAGVGLLNDFLGVSGSDEVPEDLGSDGALALLERGTLFQAQALYPESARDLGAADEALEFLDISIDVAGDVGQFTYSDSAKIYRATPTEKLSLNGINLLNYLAQGDLRGAAVEARRFTVMRNYLMDYDSDHAYCAFGSYLAGFVFEKLGEPDRALRYYDEALVGGQLEGLDPTLVRLAPVTSHRGTRVKQRITELEEDGAVATSKPVSEILTVVGVGRVPFKVPARIPIGRAVGIAGIWVTGDLEVLKYGALKVVSYPELAPSPTLFDGASVRVDGRPARVDLVSRLGNEIRREYEAIKPRILGAAISRMIVRAAAAEGARAAGREDSEWLGTLAALLTEGALLAADKPDTRSWTMLPDRVFVSRTVVAPGTHTVDVRIDGGSRLQRRFEVDVPENGFAAVVWTVPR